MIDKIKAGHAQATSALLRLWLNEDTESGIDLRLFGGKMVRLQLQHMGFFISDAEAQRATFNLRGAAGIKAKTLLLRVTLLWTALGSFTKLIAHNTRN